MTQLITPGPIRLAILSSIGGSKVKTLWLPQPAKGYPELSWDAKKTDQDLVDGSERSRILGYIPVLSVRWSPYDDRANAGYTLGTLDGQRPTLEQLLPILCNASGFLKVSLGNMGTPLGFVVGRCDVDKLPLKGNGFIDLTVTFRGRDIVADRTLGAF
jgi:hypothetical protein